MASSDLPIAPSGIGTRNSRPMIASRPPSEHDGCPPRVSYPPVRHFDPRRFGKAPPHTTLEETIQAVVDAVDLLPQDLAVLVASLSWDPPSRFLKAQLRRLDRELQIYCASEQDPSLLFFGPQDATIDPLLWRATFLGPPDTPYEGGTFHLELKIPQDYPFRPPKMKLLTPIYHCCFNEDGYHCMDEPQWLPSCLLTHTIQAVRSLLACANPDDPVRPDIAQRYKTDRKLHDDTAREWTRVHAYTPLAYVGASPVSEKRGGTSPTPPAASAADP